MMVQKALKREDLTVYGDGQFVRDYIYIDDIVAALLHTICRGSAGEAYNIGSPAPMTFDDMVDAVIAAVGSGAKSYEPWPADYEKNETGDYVADTSKIERDTSWKPRVDFTDGIQDMVAYYRDNQAAYW